MGVLSNMSGYFVAMPFSRTEMSNRIACWVRSMPDRLLDMMVAFTRWRLGTGSGTGPRSPFAPKRFAVCTRFTPPLWSGQAVVIGRLLEGLSADSYCLVSLPLYPDTQDKVDYTPALPGTRYLLQPEHGIPRLPFGSAALREVWRQTGMLYQAWQRGVHIARILRGDPTDTLVGCSGDLLDLPASWIAARLLRRRLVVHFFDDYTEQWWAEPALSRFAARLEQRIVAHASKVIVTNEFMRREMLRRHGKPSDIVRNPRQAGDLVSPLERYPARNDEVRLVFTGAVYHLNYDILRAVASALATIPGRLHRLHIYTAQPAAQLEAEGLVGPHVVIHGHVSPEEAARIQATADILLIPFSFREDAEGIIRTAATAKLADYLAAGRPIIALCQRDSFLAWFLEDRACGLVVSTSEPEEIARTICRMGSDAELRLRLQLNAHRCAHNEFDPDVAQHSLLQALEMTDSAIPTFRCAPPAKPEGS